MQAAIWKFNSFAKGAKQWGRILHPFSKLHVRDVTYQQYYILCIVDLEFISDTVVIEI